MKLLALLIGILALSASARAALTVNSISGDEYSLHAEFSVDWVNGTSQTAQGSWPGGNWEFLSLNGPLSTHHDEGITQFYLRNIWSDGWNPGPVWYLRQISSQPSARTDINFQLGNINLADPVTFDYANTGLQYHLDASLFGDFSTHETGGAARLVFDLQRTPISPVPDGGSTLLLLAIACGPLLQPSFKTASRLNLRCAPVSAPSASRTMISLPLKLARNRAALIAWS